MWEETKGPGLLIETKDARLFKTAVQKSIFQSYLSCRLQRLGLHWWVGGCLGDWFTCCHFTALLEQSALPARCRPRNLSRLLYGVLCLLCQYDSFYGMYYYCWSYYFLSTFSYYLTKWSHSFIIFDQGNLFFDLVIKETYFQKNLAWLPFRRVQCYYFLPW